MRMTLDERRERAAKRKADRAALDAAQAKARDVVATGKCPTCGAPLRRNLSLRGWFQCEQFGAPMFRKDATKPACGFQCFTE